MTQEELRKVGQIQLDIMDEVHRICLENQITYYMIGGTLLGAVRHKGFIPWDLDIDIGMPREDYERFQAVCKTQLADRFSYIDYNDFRYFPRPHALVTRNDTKIYLQYDHVNPKVWERGVYLDVFPLDNAPDDQKLRQKQAKLLRKLRLLKEHRIPYAYTYKAWKRGLHYIRSGLLSLISVKKLNAYEQKQMQKYRDENTKRVCTMASQYPYESQCMDRQIYGAPVLLEFEGRQYYAPAKYCEYLAQSYGDYMQFPPEAERQANLEVFTSVEFLDPVIS